MRHASIYYAMLRYLQSLEAAANTDPEVQGALLVLNMKEIVPSSTIGPMMDCAAATVGAAGLSSLGE